MRKIIIFISSFIFFSNLNATDNLQFFVKKAIENNLQLNAERKNFESAKSIAAENDKNHLLFKFLLGKIYMATGDTQMAINHFHQFLYSTSSSEYYIDKRFLIEAYGFLIELLYKNGSFNEIAKIEMDLSDNIKYTSNNYNTVFSLTYFYIGAALLNIGDLNNGLYYLIKSKRESSSENLKTLINQIIDRVENSL